MSNSRTHVNKDSMECSVLFKQTRSINAVHCGKGWEIRKTEILYFFSKCNMLPVFFTVLACYTEELFYNGLFNVHIIYSHLRFYVMVKCGSFFDIIRFLFPYLPKHKSCNQMAFNIQNIFKTEKIECVKLMF